MTRRRTTLPTLLLSGGLLTVGLLAAACGGSDDEGSSSGSSTGDPSTTSTADAGPPQEGGTLVYGLSGETNTWDPTAGEWSAPGWTVARTFYDTLMMYDENTELQPHLAESVEHNDDYTMWTITPREGVTFHNGEPLDAETIKLNLDRAIASPLVGTALGPVQSVEVVDGEVVITLDRSWVRFPQVLGHSAGVMVAPETIADPQGGTRPIGTGPFVFEEWVPDSHLVVSRHPDYWGEPAHLDGIEFKVITDHNTRSLALRSGQLDAGLITLANDLVDFMAEEENGTFQVLPPTAGEETEVIFLLNLDREPFTDPRVREALALATDRQGLIDSLREGLYEPADGIYPPDSPWYAPTDYPDFDPDRARQLVDEWEAETGQELGFTLSGPQEATTVQALQAVQAQWGEVGIDVEIQTLELAEFISRGLLGDYEVAIWQWYSSPHPDGEYVWLHSENAQPEGQLALNYGRIRDDTIDAALEEARGVDDDDRALELYGEIQEAMADRVYHVFLYHDFSAVVAQPETHGIYDWTLPDGSPGAGMIQLEPVFTAAWLDA